MAGNLAGGEQRAIHHSPWCVLAVAGLPSGNRDLGFRLLRGTVYGDRAVDAGISGSARPGPVAHIHLLPQCSLAREAEAKLCASAPVDVTKDTGTEDVVSVPPHCWQAGPPFAPPQSASTHQGKIIVEIRPCAPGAQPLLGRRNRLQPPSPCPRRRKLRRLQPCCPGGTGLSSVTVFSGAGLHTVTKGGMRHASLQSAGGQALHKSGGQARLIPTPKRRDSGARLPRYKGPIGHGASGAPSPSLPCKFLIAMLL